MATNYTTNLALAKPTTGELAGTWGDVVNQQITDMLEEAITGIATINGWVTNAQTLTLPQGSTGAARAAILDLQDAAGLTAAGTLNIPDGITKIYIVVNNTSYQVTVKTVTGTGIAVPTGETMWVYSDGTNIVEATNTYLSSITVASLTATTADINGGTIDGTTIGATTPAAGTFSSIATTGDISFGDNDKAIFGAGSDLQIYHDAGGTSYITEAGTGNLLINASNLWLQSAAGEAYASFVADGAATLYYDNLPKLATTSTGVDVTGTATMDGLTVDGNGSFNGTVPILDFIETDTANVNTRLALSSGYFRAETLNDAKSSATKRFEINNNTGDISFYEDTGTTAKFFWDASAESLGIGTTSPSSFNSEANNLVVGDGVGNNGITIYGQSNAYSQIYFADGTTNPAPYAGYIRYDHGANAMRFATNDGSERMRIDSAGNVGIGTATPTDNGVNAKNLTISANSFPAVDFKGTINSNSGFVSLNDSANTFNVGSVSSTPLVCYTANTERLRIDSSGYTTFKTASGELRIGLDGNNDIYTTSILRTTAAQHHFKIAGTGEVARIDSSGNLLVGKTSIASAVSTAGSHIEAGGKAFHVKSGDIALALGRLTSDGDILGFYKDGTTVGSIGVKSSGLVVGNTTANSALRFTANSITAFDPVTQTDTGADGDTSLGNSAVRFKDLYLSGGVYVGGTGAANYLDDYEESSNYGATWNGISVGNGSLVTTYTKVGSVVVVNGVFALGSTSTVTGAVTVSLPFVPSNSSVGSTYLNDNGTAGYVGWCRALQGAALAYIYSGNTGSTYSSVGGINSTTPFTWTTGDQIYFTITYTTT